jgi:protein O-GlcNAc transferase
MASLGRRLAEQRSTAPLFDTPLFTRHIEAGYQAMYQRHHAGLSPDHIDVDPGIA